MDISIALELCRNYGKSRGITNFIEILEAMKVQKDKGDLAIITEQAFNKVVSQTLNFS